MDIVWHVEQSIKRYSNRIKSLNIYHKPDIPKHKLKNCLKYFVEGVQEDEVLVLLDTSSGGTGKRGMVLTNQKLYALSKKIGPKQIALSEIKKVRIKIGFKGLLSVNDNEFCQYSSIYEKELLWIKEQLGDIYAVFKTRERNLRLEQKKEEVLNRAEQWWLHKPDPKTGTFICDVCNRAIQQKEGTSLLGTYMRCTSCTQSLFARWNQGEDF